MKSRTAAGQPGSAASRSSSNPATTRPSCGAPSRSKRAGISPAGMSSGSPRAARSRPAAKACTLQSPRRASTAAKVTEPFAASAAAARTSKVEIPVAGIPSAWWKPNAVASPMRAPVKLPGPRKATIPPRSAGRIPVSTSTSRIISRTWFDERSIGASRTAASAPPRATATLTRGEPVSRARMGEPVWIMAVKYRPDARIYSLSMSSHLPAISLGGMTPMLRQYLELKAAHADAVLLYRMGDFYEMFFEDARLAAPILEVQLTARHKGSEHETPMCGVPYHALESYLGKLLAAGLKVAICDQVEDPAQAKGLVKREVTRVVTPGTVSDPELLDGKEENLLAALVWDGEAGGAAFLDLSTGSFFVRRWSAVEEGIEDLALLRPREILFHGAQGQDGFPKEIVDWAERECPCRTVLAEDRLFAPQRAGELLLRQFEASSLRGFGLYDGESVVRAAAAALAYAQETQKSDLSHVRGQ